MRAVVLAYHEIGCVGLEALLEAGFDVPVVFTHADDPAENRWFRSVAEVATSHGIPVWAPEDIHHEMWVRKIRDAEPDVLFSLYWRRLVRPEILSIPRLGGLNLHGSLLPRYRGRCPINWTILEGETETGVTLHHMTPRADEGDIVGQRRFPIGPDDTAYSVHLRTAREASELLAEVLPAIRDGVAPRTPQDEAKATYRGARTPADGRIDWSRSARSVRDLVRAVTRPYPGAFSHVGGRKCFFWAVEETPEVPADARPGTVVSSSPVVVACGDGGVRIVAGQREGGLYSSGDQLGEELGLEVGARFGDPLAPATAREPVKVLILGVNGFVGNALGQRLLSDGHYEVHGIDLRSNYVEHLIGRPGFHFTEGDISIHREWIEYHVRKCDVVLPLVAIATPIEYTRNPLRVFELDFEENLRVVRYCVKYGKRIVFPSTSEVYGMCEDEEFDEESSRLVLGPIRMQRWIYSCSKQLLDRVIWAYGQSRGLRFSIFRPFNWIGPKLDTLDSARIGSSRVVTQLILNLVEGTPIQLVDGGLQRRCFTDISDGVECLARIIANDGGRCDGRIINIGNPDNDAGIRELAELLVDRFEKHPLRGEFPPFAGFREIESGAYYGRGYQDMHRRKPSIRNARRILDWAPKVDLETSVEQTLDFFLRVYLEREKEGLVEERGGE